MRVKTKQELFSLRGLNQTITVYESLICMYLTKNNNDLTFNEFYVIIYLTQLQFGFQR
jgi:hypothetical protein